MHPKPPTRLNQGRRHTHNKEGINMDTKMQAGVRQRSTPSIQPLAGVPVVASLLGHSHKQKERKNNTRCVIVPKHRWNTWAAQPA